MLRHVHLTVEPIGPIRVENLKGVPFKVFPAVLVREKVLNNNIGRCFLPWEQIQATTDAWNNIPVVIRHPTLRGIPVSARTPEVLNARGVGYVFHAAADASRRALVGDVYVNMAWVEGVPDATQVVNKVEKEGQPGEVSTGFGTNVEEQPGTWEGQAFDYVMRDIVPDHFALLVEETGACSVADGCGLGVNCSCHEESTVMTLPEDQDPPQDDPAPSGEPAAEPEPAVQTNITVNASPEDTPQGLLARFKAALRGWMAPDSARNESDEDRMRLLHGALMEAFGPRDGYLWIVATFTDEGKVVFEREDRDGASDGTFRTTFEITNEGTVSLGDLEEVRRITEFVPVSNDDPGEHNDLSQGGEMNRDEVIAQLAERSPFKAEWLTTLSDEELTATLARFPAEDPPAADAPAEQEPAPAVQAEAVNRLITEVENLRKANETQAQKIATLEATTAPAVQEQARERETLIATLAANERCDFTAEELGAKGLDELRKIERLSRQPSYLGRGGPKIPAAQAEDSPFLAPKPYWDQPTQAPKEA